MNFQAAMLVLPSLRLKSPSKNGFMEPKYLSFRFGDYNPFAHHHLTFGGSPGCFRALFLYGSSMLAFQCVSVSLKKTSPGFGHKRRLVPAKPDRLKGPTWNSLKTEELGSTWRIWSSCWWFRNPAFTSWYGSLSHYLQGGCTSQVVSRISAINSSK